MPVGKKITPMKKSPMKLTGLEIMAIASLVGTGVEAYGNYRNANKQLDVQRKARSRNAANYEKNVRALQDMEVSNPYANIQTKFENPYEDLTVNQQAAQFASRQAAQSRANVMNQFRGAAGASGIAGLAQAMANQATLQGARISAGIGQQESRNQALRAQGAARVQQMEQQAEAKIAYGNYLKEQNENQKTLNLMNLGAGQEAAQTTFDANEQLLKNQKTSAITGAIAGVAETTFDFAQMGGFGGGQVGEASMSFPEFSTIPNNYQIGDELTNQLNRKNQYNPYSLDVELPPIFTNDQFGALGTYNPYSVNNNFTPGFNYDYINTSSNQ